MRESGIPKLGLSVVMALVLALAGIGAFAMAPSQAYAGLQAASLAKAKPAKAVVSKVSSSSAGKVTVKVRKVSGASGYEYRIARNKAMTKSVKKATASSRSKTFSGLAKGTTYYVKVRAYKKVAGKKVRGPWSSVKSVTSQVSNGIYLCRLFGGGKASVSGSKITLRNKIVRMKSWAPFWSGTFKVKGGSVTIPLGKGTSYSSDLSGGYRSYSRAGFAKALKSKGLSCWLVVRVEGGETVSASLSYL